MQLTCFLAVKRLSYVSIEHFVYNLFSGCYLCSKHLLACNNDALLTHYGAAAASCV
jgi:hypothetical protein